METDQRTYSTKRTKNRVQSSPSDSHRKAVGRRDICSLPNKFIAINQAERDWRSYFQRLVDGLQPLPALMTERFDPVRDEMYHEDATKDVTTEEEAACVCRGKLVAKKQS
jgi:hypothetical protein